MNNIINSNSSIRNSNPRKQLVLVVLPPVLQPVLSPVLPPVLPPVLVLVHQLLLNSSIRSRQSMGASKTTSSKIRRRFFS